MKLATFRLDGAPRCGVVVGDEIVDLSVAAPELPSEMSVLLAAGDAALEAAARASEGSAGRYALSAVRLCSPVLRPPKILAAGINFAAHAAEAEAKGMKKPPVPVIFNKQSTSASGPYDDIHLPRASKILDYEGELGVVIGKRCRHVPRERALEVIAGYVVVNDVTIRDWQIKSPTMTMGKSWDTHCPNGPWIVTKDEIRDPHDLHLQTWVNGELRQDAKTNDLIDDSFALIEHCSTAFTLEPGDLIATGTPAGSAMAMEPPQWLVAGDVVKVAIEGIGEIESTVVDEPADTAFIG